MPEAEAILRRLDRVLSELLELRSEVAAQMDKGNGLAVGDDFAPENLLDTVAAAARFGFPRDIVARWCRESCGVKRGGRWMASVHACGRTSTENKSAATPLLLNRTITEPEFIQSGLTLSGRTVVRAHRADRD